VTGEELADLLAACDDPDMAALLLELAGGEGEDDAEPGPAAALTAQSAPPREPEAREGVQAQDGVLTAIADLVQGCTLCPLCRGRTRAVPGEGPASARLLIVGEGPGRHEDRAGRPFVGPAGQLLDRLLREAGIDRERVFVTNAVRCRPPGNRTPTPEELSACWLWTEQIIAAVDPDYILALGATALSLFDPSRRIRRDHGQPFWWQARRVLPTFHPAAALRDKAVEDDLRADLGLFGLILQDAREALRRPLAEFAKGEYIVRVRSRLLGETVAFVSGEPEAEECWRAGIVPYTAAELEDLLADPPADLTALHMAKKLMRGTVLKSRDGTGATAAEAEGALQRA
jgi:uracil-DNA glycosylase family 4